MIDAGISGKTAIVTGGSRGIGRAITLLLAAEGASVTFLYRDAAAADEVITAGRAQGNTIAAAQVDVRDSKACAAAAEAIAERSGRIDILVNNAGTIRDTLHGGSAGCRVAHVDLVGGDPASGGIAVGDDSVCRIGVAAIEERHVGAFGREEQRDRAADPATAAGDDGGFARDSCLDHRFEAPRQPEIAKPPSTTSVCPLIIAASGRQRR